eukprot:6314310-Prymnesium_polylepis.1
MARYEASGDGALRQAAENFFSEVSAGHTYVTGSSTTGEIWLAANRLADPVMAQHAENYWSHDHAETCVAHNRRVPQLRQANTHVAPRVPQLMRRPAAPPHADSPHDASALPTESAPPACAPRALDRRPDTRAPCSMRVSRRLMQWGATAEDSTLEHLLSHAAYYERTLHNAVLGTQRGTLPGQMLYMMPMGSGVSKAGIPNAPQGHHWSDAEHHFWCCQGSGIEAFAKLADSIFWEHVPVDSAPAARLGGEPEVRSHHLFVLQLLPSEL